MQCGDIRLPSSCLAKALDLTAITAGAEVLNKAVLGKPNMPVVPIERLQRQRFEPPSFPCSSTAGEKKEKSAQRAEASRQQYNARA